MTIKEKLNLYFKKPVHLYEQSIKNAMDIFERETGMKPKPGISVEYVIKKYMEQSK